jgi:peptidoglycan/LPS O-acetylase OafA/YrhL
LGGTSYVLYCLHWPLREVLHALGFTPPASPALHALTVYLSVTLVSLAIYHWGEAPARKLLVRKLGLTARAGHE